MVLTFPHINTNSFIMHSMKIFRRVTQHKIAPNKARLPMKFIWLNHRKRLIILSYRLNVADSSRNPLSFSIFLFLWVRMIAYLPNNELRFCTKEKKKFNNKSPFPHTFWKKNSKFYHMGFELWAFNIQEEKNEKFCGNLWSVLDHDFPIWTYN